MASDRACIVLVGNQKGGTGKSTTAIHLIVGLAKAGYSVASIDLDVAQRSLTRFIDNRDVFACKRGLKLPMPRHRSFSGANGVDGKDRPGVGEDDPVRVLIEELGGSHDYVVVDTPGSDGTLTRLAHSHADVLVTPLNDSFIDLDVLADVDPNTMKVRRPSRYATMVWEEKKRHAARDGGSTDWIVMRNRLSSLDAHSKRTMARLLADLSKRIGFRLVAGFGERVIYKELFYKGLTILDLSDETAGAHGLKMSHIAARQEVRNLVEAVLARPER